MGLKLAKIIKGDGSIGTSATLETFLKSFGVSVSRKSERPNKGTTRRSLKKRKVRSNMGFDWSNSKAHLLLLSMFRYPCSHTALANYPWNKLSEPLEDAITRFIDEGMVMPADISELLSLKYRFIELHNMLKARGLLLSGSKSAKIKRLLRADRDGMLTAVSDMNGYDKCTQRGQEIVMKYLSAKKEERLEHLQQVEECVRNRKFNEASGVVSLYWADQVFPRYITIGINGMSENEKHLQRQRDIQILNTIFSSKPKILRKMGYESLEKLRCCAALIYLCDAELPVENIKAANMILSYALHKESLEGYRNSGVCKQVKILTYGGSCSACNKMASITYDLSEVPELPHENCTNERGCICNMVSIVYTKDEIE